MAGLDKKRLAVVGALVAVGVALPVLLVDLVEERTQDAVARELAASSGAPHTAIPVHPEPEGDHRGGPAAVTVDSSPILCTGQATIVRTNERIHITGPRAAVVRGGCELKLVNVELRAADGVVVEDGRLEMVDGSIEARGVAIHAEGESEVVLSGVDVRGATGLELAGTAHVRATDATLRGSGVAIVARDEAQAVLSRTEIVGPVAENDAAGVTVVDDE